jgi:hypothetical protein
VDATLADVVITANATDAEGGGLLLDERARLTWTGWSRRAARPTAQGPGSARGRS